MSVMQSLEKGCSKLKVSEKEKSEIPPENAIDFNKDNVTRNENILKNVQHVNHKDTNLGREYFNHISKLVTVARNKERDPHKKYADKDRYNIGKYASKNGPIATVRKFA